MSKYSETDCYQNIELPLNGGRVIPVTIKRLDLLHPDIQGNKYYKLKYNLEEARLSGHDTLLTFGGAYSNHIHATAVAAREAGMKAIGVIRGEPAFPLNPTLSTVQALGMHLHYISRGDYRQKKTGKILDALKAKFGRFYLLPEGGTNHLAIKGCEEILNHEDKQALFVAVPIGTGGTFCGLVSSAEPGQTIMGFSSLKGEFIRNEVQELLQVYSIRPRCQWEIYTRYHFGGYAKFTPELLGFVKSFRLTTGIPLDPIYTGKMMYGMLDLAEKGRFVEDSRILVLHTGGLQGIPGFNERFGTNL
ncbi:1-aminocyclopropane-1-carboxylate deaminase/D-cysteine desulfhydrase [Negadavirga shengliensis]|uniref:1-aminocyclopropane-1-carboxylate deaminase/D-cysteine desulfhydrase n=1 Tax=Negadavirga shengliensis TaxID=1389218 RepID=A0ABV9SVG2_9BACT